MGRKGRKPMIALTATIGLADAVAARGGDIDRVLRSVGLARSILDDQRGFMACRDFARLLDVAAQDTGDPCFGLHFGAQFQPKNLGAVSYVALNSPTVGAAIENIARYERVHNEAADVSDRKSTRLNSSHLGISYAVFC